ncbi:MULTISPECIES: hypothetical protein [unclassified Ensifer]|uniref:hypothetical protein n=1 Tax=unclassified Ensifer TaxID=2633371 RepID=UPI0008139A07|nr:MULTISPECIES: hypothetical protein [unclassified Ensifer]OCP04999.1 hypothetical protein BC362_14665 [Ensifer sp. LC14]OCP11842.1 hypothetical protein BC374_16340 [Ensifer sp. LC13]OCP12399.1 hypothetical protein BBX50_16540 [Ensifer sp. LC11]OCP33634.1 hypothetical protein BC364_15305 [Ensifer sp. LC499]
MTVKLASLRADLEREVVGDWIDYPPLPGVAFNVRSLRAPSYVTKRDLVLQRLARTYGNETPPADVAARETGALYCAEVLNGWRGLDVEYSPSVALEILTDPAYRYVTEAVEWCASQIARMNIEFTEMTVKKSEPAFAGG